MSHNTFGHLFRVTTFGESHGPGIGCVVDGRPVADPAGKRRISRPISTAAGPMLGFTTTVPGAGRNENPVRRDGRRTDRARRRVEAEVSIPVPSPTSGDQESEPVAVSEEAERALLVSSVAPVYPPEAASQKAQGPVVLQATIGRDGTVEDLKIVRGRSTIEGGDRRGEAVALSTIQAERAPGPDPDSADN